MTVQTLKSILSLYEVERVFLNQMTKNKISKKSKWVYKDGFVEFSSVDAALKAVQIFNGQPLLGNKSFEFYGDFISLEFRPNFNWTDLLEEI